MNLYKYKNHYYLKIIFSYSDVDPSGIPGYLQIGTGIIKKEDEINISQLDHIAEYDNEIFSKSVVVNECIINSPSTKEFIPGHFYVEKVYGIIAICGILDDKIGLFSYSSGNRMYHFLDKDFSKKWTFGLKLHNLNSEKDNVNFIKD